MAAPDSIPSEVPIGSPYWSTNSPAGIARVAKRWPGGTTALTTISRPSGSNSSSPGAVSVLTTATLSFASTMIAYSDTGAASSVVVINVCPSGSTKPKHLAESATAHLGADGSKALDSDQADAAEFRDRRQFRH